MGRLVYTHWLVSFGESMTKDPKGRSLLGGCPVWVGHGYLGKIWEPAEGGRSEGWDWYDHYSLFL